MRKMKWAGRYRVDPAPPDASECFKEHERCVSVVARLEAERWGAVAEIVCLKANCSPAVVEQWLPWNEEIVRRYDRQIADKKEEAGLWLARARIAQADEVAGLLC
jgi:hypothetical protein